MWSQPQPLVLATRFSRSPCGSPLPLGCHSTLLHRLKSPVAGPTSSHPRLSPHRQQSKCFLRYHTQINKKSGSRWAGKGSLVSRRSKCSPPVPIFRWGRSPIPRLHSTRQASSGLTHIVTECPLTLYLRHHTSKLEGL